MAYATMLIFLGLYRALDFGDVFISANRNEPDRMYIIGYLFRLIVGVKLNNFESSRLVLLKNSFEFVHDVVT